MTWSEIEVENICSSEFRDIRGRSENKEVDTTKFRVCINANGKFTHTLHVKTSYDFTNVPCRLLLRLHSIVLGRVVLSLQK